MRVIAGSAGGVRLAVSKRGVRPTMDRVKAAIFSSLGDTIIGASVLDLFAGSGALGIEALSRGASSVLFVEEDRQSIEVIQKNLAKTRLEGCVRRQDVFDFLRISSGIAKFHVVFADPPYNVAIDGNATGLGRIRHREFPMATGEMSTPQYLNFLRTVCNNLVEASTDGAIHFICMDWRHAKVLLLAADDIYSELKNICVWNKTNGGMGSFYRSKHEFVFVWKSGTAAHINNIDLGRSGRFRTNVWDYAGANSFGSARSQELAMHPTVKPTMTYV